MEVILENIISYGLIFLLIALVILFYIGNSKKQSKLVRNKIEKAKEFGFHEPVSLHPVVNLDICLGSGACVAACPEKDILGLVDGRAALVNASRCVGHGACFHACPVGAITLVIGTEKRGVELPHVSSEFETNVKGIYIAGELGGMGLIKNAVEQGRQAVENISKHLSRSNDADYDVVIIGAGPAGISATLAAKQKHLRYLTLEQDSLGGTVYSFPRKKIVMTSPMHLPLYGKLYLRETSKSELLEIWWDVLEKNKITINENEKVLSINKTNGCFEIESGKSTYRTNTVLLAIGRRGSPRKIEAPGAQNEKVMYRLLEPEMIQGQRVLVVGGGDSAVESALLLCNQNNDVSLSYRGDSFSRIKPMNHERIIRAIDEGIIHIYYNSTVKEVKDKSVILSVSKEGKISEQEIENDLVYGFLGGELPNQFLQQMGIAITKKYGEAVLKH